MLMGDGFTTHSSSGTARWTPSRGTSFKGDEKQSQVHEGQEDSANSDTDLPDALGRKLEPELNPWDMALSMAIRLK